MSTNISRTLICGFAAAMAGCATGIPVNDVREPVLSSAPAASSLPAARTPAGKADFTYHPSGAFKAIGAMGPSGTPASAEKPARLIEKIPADFTSPIYAVFRFGAGQEVGIVSNEPGGKLDRFVVDSNGNADLTDDPVVPWRAAGDIVYMQVQMNLDGVKRPATYGIYRTGATAEQRGYFTTFPDYYVGGTVTLDGKTYNALLWDARGTASFSAASPPPAAAGDEGAGQGRRRGGGPTLMIDIDGSNSYHPQTEHFRAFDPFNIGGVTYEFRSLKADGSGVELWKSDREVAPRVAQPPPDPNLGNGLVAGKSALDFQATTLDGKTIRLFDSYKGKIVMLDFWATWCGPCMREMPHVSAAYQELKDRGFTVLGISLDRENAAEKIREVAGKNNMPWQQVYDGKYFEAAIAKQYQIKSIPAAYLIDGDTGKILANGSDLRGDKLVPAIEKALAAKKQRS